MMKKLLLPCLILWIAFSCTKTPEACVIIASNTSSVEQTVRLQSCSKNATYHDWMIDGIQASTLVGITGGLPYTVMEGSEDINCADYMDIVFHEPGTYTLGLKTPKLKSGTCSSNSISWKKSSEDETVITITP